MLASLVITNLQSYLEGRVRGNFVEGAFFDDLHKSIIRDNKSVSTDEVI